MTSIIRLTPLSGGGDESPHCYLLEVDGFNILLDIGWDEKFSPAFITTLAKVVPKVDAVLLTYPDLPHLGALPVAVDVPLRYLSGMAPPSTMSSSLPWTPSSRPGTT